MPRPPTVENIRLVHLTPHRTGAQGHTTPCYYSEQVNQRGPYHRK